MRKMLKSLSCSATEQWTTNLI